MSHSHDHSHHGHSHGAGNLIGRAFVWSVALNLCIVVVEIVAGLWSGSLALIADSAHNLGDVLGLLMAWGAIRLSKIKSTPRYTYGLRRSTILAALANALLLLVGTGGLMLEACQRLQAGSPAPSQPGLIMGVAALGVLLNGISALLLSRHGGDLNLKGAFLHLVSDALVSSAVVVSGAIIYFTGWSAVDPVTTLMVGLTILWGTWGLFRESVALSLDAVPADIVPTEVEEYLRTLEGVMALHDLHIWPIGTDHTALSVHLVRPCGLDDCFLRQVASDLKEKFKIAHTTIQLEYGDMDCQCGPQEHTRVNG